jgi:hypothetical protein
VGETVILKVEGDAFRLKLGLSGLKIAPGRGPEREMGKRIAPFDLITLLLGEKRDERGSKA